MCYFVVFLSTKQIFPFIHSIMERKEALPPICQALQPSAKQSKPLQRRPHRPWGGPAACPRAGGRLSLHPGGRYPRSQRHRRTGWARSLSAPVQAQVRNWTGSLYLGLHRKHLCIASAQLVHNCDNYRCMIQNNTQNCNYCLHAMTVQSSSLTPNQDQMWSVLKRLKLNMFSVQWGSSNKKMIICLVFIC